MKRIMKKLAVLVIMLAALTLIVPDTDAFGFCEGCTNNCRNESLSVYLDCRSNGGSTGQCETEQANYNYACQSVFCDGCPFLPL